jgi:Family of unknown function (DUF5675)
VGAFLKNETMQLELIRTYYPEGTNGKIFFNGRLLIHSIELPWKDNQARVSCIPEGKYELVKRWSLKFGRHLLLMDVPQRKYILIHPANNALQELKGCIAPVWLIIGAGKGLRSRMALEILTSLVYGALDLREQVFLIIKSEPYEFS